MLLNPFVTSVVTSVSYVNTHTGTNITKNITSKTTSRAMHKTSDTKMPTPIIFNFSLSVLAGLAMEYLY